MKIVGIKLHSFKMSKDETELKFSTAELGPIRTGFGLVDVSVSIRNAKTNSLELVLADEYEIEIRRVKTQEELNKEKSNV